MYCVKHVLSLYYNIIFCTLNDLKSKFQKYIIFFFFLRYICTKIVTINSYMQFESLDAFENMKCDRGHSGR